MASKSTGSPSPQDRDPAENVEPLDAPSLQPFIPLDSGNQEDIMAKYSRESRMRAIKAGYAPPIACPSCGQSFWTEAQRREHVRISAGTSYCQYAPAGPRP